MKARYSPDFLIVGTMLAASLLALTTAWIAQYGFGLFPCKLCLYQRLPYFGAAALSALSLMPVVDPASRKRAVQLGAALFMTTAGIAAFHVGVEQGWWKTSCAPTGVQALSFEDIQAALQRPGAPACNDVPFTLFGVSMAGYNMIAGLILAGLALWSARKPNWWKDE